MRFPTQQKQVFSLAVRGFTLVVVALFWAFPSRPQQAAPQTAILFQNARVFNGTDNLSAG